MLGFGFEVVVEVGFISALDEDALREVTHEAVLLGLIHEHLRDEPPHGLESLGTETGWLVGNDPRFAEGALSSQRMENIETCILVGGSMAEEGLR